MKYTKPGNDISPLKWRIGKSGSSSIYLLEVIPLEPNLLSLHNILTRGLFDFKNTIDDISVHRYVISQKCHLEWYLSGHSLEIYLYTYVCGSVFMLFKITHVKRPLRFPDLHPLDVTSFIGHLWRHNLRYFWVTFYRSFFSHLLREKQYLKFGVFHYQGKRIILTINGRWCHRIRRGLDFCSD